mmetsp:Transcript_29969/g.26486  ORF Transcript_29969/g.26486 Transcript_29969/m.26486 type:complete len:145 (+) Transcript_29969:70-504(+)
MVFRQTFDANSPWTKDVISRNSEDPSAPNYSILDRLDKFRDSKDKTFEFKLFWPNNPNLHCQHWKQKSNPTKKSDVTGYIALSIKHTENQWDGLKWNGKYCLIAGSSKSSGLWYYALGSYISWNGAMPGPQGAVNKVELWVKAS